MNDFVVGIFLVDNNLRFYLVIGHPTISKTSRQKLVDSVYIINIVYRLTPSFPIL